MQTVSSNFSPFNFQSLVYYYLFFHFRQFLFNLHFISKYKLPLPLITMWFNWEEGGVLLNPCGNYLEVLRPIDFNQPHWWSKITTDIFYWPPWSGYCTDVRKYLVGPRLYWTHRFRGNRCL